MQRDSPRRPQRSQRFVIGLQTSSAPETVRRQGAIPSVTLPGSSMQQGSPAVPHPGLSSV